MTDPLHATIEGFAADGYTHIECHCPRCRVTRLWPVGWLPKIWMGLTLEAQQHCQAAPTLLRSEG